ncbi:hypothetical protein [Lysobacter antibioticus]|uniref:hypothetical protein n=1 Tax=Lysobacter antibioticus TaxID=84531 RepID=UPI00126A76B5|nr:hypothetical protein [Lysobacter antibioticus]
MGTEQSLDSRVGRSVAIAATCSMAALLSFIGTIFVLSIGWLLKSTDLTSIGIWTAISSIAVHFCAALAHSWSFLLSIFARHRRRESPGTSLFDDRFFVGALIAWVAFGMVKTAIPSIPYVYVSSSMWGFLVGMAAGLCIAMRFHKESVARLKAIDVTNKSQSSLSA